MACTPDEQLTVVSYGGGSYQKSHQTHLIDPFQEDSGIAVSSVAWNAEYGRIKQMVKSNSVKWDVVEVTAAQFARGKSENLFEKIDQVSLF